VAWGGHSGPDQVRNAPPTHHQLSRPPGQPPRFPRWACSSAIQGGVEEAHCQRELLVCHSGPDQVRETTSTPHPPSRHAGQPQISRWACSSRIQCGVEAAHGERELLVGYSGPDQVRNGPPTHHQLSRPPGQPPGFPRWACSSRMQCGVWAARWGWKLAVRGSGPDQVRKAPATPHLPSRPLGQPQISRWACSLRIQCGVEAAHGEWELLVRYSGPDQVRNDPPTHHQLSRPPAQPPRFPRWACSAGG